MRRLRVLCLMHDYLVPPEDDTKYDTSVAWKTEFDVKNTLEVMGHEVRVVGVADDLAVMRNATKEFARANVSRLFSPKLSDCPPPIDSPARARDSRSAFTE